MKNRYIGVYAKNENDSHEYQKILFNKGFQWVSSGFNLTNHTNFYARLEDMKIITCYHDPSIDEESVNLSINELKQWVIE